MVIGTTSSAHIDNATGTSDVVGWQFSLLNEIGVAVQRSTSPLAKPVQIVGGLGVRAAAKANRNAASDTSGHGHQRTRSAHRRVARAEPTGGRLETAPTTVGRPLAERDLWSPIVPRATRSMVRRVVFRVMTCRERGQADPGRLGRRLRRAAPRAPRDRERLLRVSSDCARGAAGSLASGAQPDRGRRSGARHRGGARRQTVTDMRGRRDPRGRVLRSRRGIAANEEAANACCRSRSRAADFAHVLQRMMYYRLAYEPWPTSDTDEMSPKC